MLLLPLPKLDSPLAKGLRINKREDSNSFSDISEHSKIVFKEVISWASRNFYNFLFSVGLFVKLINQWWFKAIAAFGLISGSTCNNFNKKSIPDTDSV